MTVSTHILDGALGRPAAGVRVTLADHTDDGWLDVETARTDDDGRIRFTVEPAAGVHRLVFDTGAYFAVQGRPAFYPEVAVAFTVTDPAAHHHVPLLLSPFAYSTYRGS